MEYQFKQVPAGGIRLAYVERGEGVPVVLVHGGGPTDLRTWGAQIDPFAEQFRVIAYSQRYHYPNGWVGDGADINSTAVHAGDLAALIDALQLGPVHLAGTSYGADIILRLAVERPELVRTLVIGEPALFSWLGTLPEGPEMFATFADMILPAKRAVQQGDTERGLRLFADVVIGEGLFDQLPASLQERFRANARLLGAEPTEFNQIDTDITREEATGIQVPALLLTGDGSSRMFLLVSQELARLLPNVEAVQIEGAAHVLHVMNPEAYNRTVLAFLAKHTG